MSLARRIALPVLVALLVGAITHAVTFRYTLPAHAAGAGCVEDPASPAPDLDSALLYGAPQGGSPRVLERHSVLGRAGQPDSASAPLTGQWTAWVMVKDLLGAESCESNLIGVNQVAGVPHPGAQHPAPGRADWFDITGRRLHGDAPPGVYVHSGHLVVMKHTFAVVEGGGER